MTLQSFQAEVLVSKVKDCKCGRRRLVRRGSYGEASDWTPALSRIVGQIMTRCAQTKYQKLSTFLSSFFSFLRAAPHPLRSLPPTTLCSCCHDSRASVFFLADEKFGVIFKLSPLLQVTLDPRHMVLLARARHVYAPAIGIRNYRASRPASSWCSCLEGFPMEEPLRRLFGRESVTYFSAIAAESCQLVLRAGLVSIRFRLLWGAAPSFFLFM